MVYNAEHKEKDQILAEELREKGLTDTVSDLNLEILKYLHKHPEVAVELEYRMRKEELHNAIMAEVQRAFTERDIKIENIEDLCTVIELDLWLSQEQK